MKNFKTFNYNKMRGKKFFELYEYYKFCGKKVIIWNSWPSNCEGLFWNGIWKEYKPRHLFKHYIKQSPQYWMVDDIIYLNKEHYKKFNEMKFKTYGGCDVEDITIYNTPFTARLINNNILLVYVEYKPIFYLTDPQNNTWVLRSTSKPMPSNKNKFIENIKKKLPHGWKISQIITDHKRYLNSDFIHTSQIINDKDGNIFMKVTLVL